MSNQEISAEAKISELAKQKIKHTEELKQVDMKLILQLDQKVGIFMFKIILNITPL